jgi:hypothetical protein
MSQPYIVLSQKPITSKHGGTVYQINLVGALDRIEYHTYIDPKMRNYKYWHRIIDNPDCGFVIRGCNIKKDCLISADSRITIVWQTDSPEDVFDELYDIWREHDINNTN